MFIVTFPFRSFHFEISQKEITADICITQLKKEKKMENEGELAKFRRRCVVSVSDHRAEMPAGPAEVRSSIYNEMYLRCSQAKEIKNSCHDFL